jgi:hypothetical protein
MWSLEASRLVCLSLTSLALGLALDLPCLAVLTGTYRARRGGGASRRCRRLPGSELDSAVTVVSGGSCA